MFVHGTAVLVGEDGVLIQGRSGSGKTSLALALLADAAGRGRFAKLIGDDRVALSLRGGRVVARPHPLIAGRIEVRGVGIRAIEHEAAGVIRLAVNLGLDASELGPRHPGGCPTIHLLGVKLPMLSLLASNGSRDNSGRVLDALGAVRQRS